MSRRFFKFGILVAILLVISPVPAAADLTTDAAIIAAQVAGKMSAQNYSVASAIFGGLAKGIAQTLMSVASIALIFTGLIFDWIVQFTIVDMAKNIGTGTPIGQSITSAWATLRDIANMCFIFVLLFAAFWTMFDLNFKNFQSTVRNIIIVALIINFSLFFSKVVIDASNIVSVGFYNSITTSKATLSGGGSGVSAATTFDKSISAGYMNMLGVQTLYGSKILENTDNLKEPHQILVIGIVSAVMMLVTAVIFLISGVMFAARFIILIFVMILSPLALIAIIIPGQEDHYKKWKTTLINQSFFAPIFFALTWVVFKLGNSILAPLKGTGSNQGNEMAQMFSNPGGTAAILVNYVLIIGFAIAALITSKSMASKSAGFKEITGGIGNAALGGTAWAGRNIVGRGSHLISETQREKWSKTAAGRAGLWLANKGKTGSFDIRATETLGKIPGLGDEMKILGKAGGKGGFNQMIEDKAKAKAKYAKDVYGQTAAEKELFEEKKKEEEASIRAGRAAKEAAARRESEAAEKARKTHLDAKLKPYTDNQESVRKEKQEQEKELSEAKRIGDAARIEKAKARLDSINVRLANEIKLKEEARKEIEETDAYKELKVIADEKREEAKKAREKLNKKEIDDEEYSKETQAINKAAEVRQREYAERVKKESPISTSVGAVSAGALGAALGSVAGPLGTAIGANIGIGLGAYVGKKVGENISINHVGSKAAARAIVDQIKGKSKKEKLIDDILKEEKEKKDKEGGGSSTPPPAPAPSAGGPAPAP